MVEMEYGSTTADSRQTPRRATWVEECSCPANYVGTSCEVRAIHADAVRSMRIEVVAIGMPSILLVDWFVFLCFFLRSVSNKVYFPHFDTDM